AIDRCDHSCDDDANKDRAGNSATDTSRRYCRCQKLSGTRPVRAATNCDDGNTGYADTRPNSCCSKPSDRSDTEPSPRAPGPPRSNHKAESRPNTHNDMEPNRRNR